MKRYSCFFKGVGSRPPQVVTLGLEPRALYFGDSPGALRDEAGLNGGFDSTSEALRDSGFTYSRAQTGDAHGYLRTLAIGFVLLALFVILGGAS